MINNLSVSRTYKASYACTAKVTGEVMASSEASEAENIKQLIQQGVTSVKKDSVVE